MSSVIGIDPGLKGGIAFVNKVCNYTWKMPVFKHNSKSVIDLHGLCDIFDECKRSSKEDIIVMIERVHAMPKQGVVSTFTFGEGYGAIKGMAVALGHSLVEVRPSEWQAALLQGVPKDLGKKRGIVYCAQRFPLYRKLTDGEADALCIALYGSQRHSVAATHLAE